MSVVRTSKYRHVFGNAAKPDDCFNGVKTDGTGDQNAAVSAKFLAFLKGKKIFIVPLSETGRKEENMMQFIDCSEKPYDVEWSPFNDNILASAHEDGAIHVWSIPENGLTEMMQTPFWTLEGVHMKKVTYIVWHPIAENILATLGQDFFIVVWNAENEDVVMKLPLAGTPSWISWNYNGSLLAVTFKETSKHNLTVCNPLNGEIISETTDVHPAPKPAKCVFLKNGNIITIGYDRQAQRSMRLWKAPTFQECIFDLFLDSSSSPLIPYYDPEIELLILAGKGESAVKYYEIADDQIYYLSTYSGQKSLKGGNFLPKTALNTTVNEIARMYRIDEKKCEPVSFIVPRKSDRFQSDIYPICRSCDPAITADEFCNGIKKDAVMYDFASHVSHGGDCKTKEPKKYARPEKKPKQQGQVQSTAEVQQSRNGIPEGIDFNELLEDMKKVKATVRKLNKRVTRLEERLEEVGADCHNEEEEEEEEEEE